MKIIHLFFLILIICAIPIATKLEGNDPVKYVRFLSKKLVRDIFTERMKNYGVKVCWRSMQDEEYFQELKRKLLEEATEMAHATSKEEWIAECADLLEIMCAYAHTYNIDMQMVEQKRLEIRKLRGGFEGRTYEEWVDIPETSEIINYYRQRPDTYPEIQ